MNEEQQRINLTNLDPVRSVFTVLGIICNCPKILRNPDMPLSESDFYKPFHKNIFAAINNIAFTDVTVEKISAIDIDNYLAQYPQNYKIYEQHKGFEYISSAIKNVNMKTYKSNYDRVKKFSMLRDYVEGGIDVKDLYNYDLTDLKQQEEQMKNLDKMNIDQITDYFNTKMLNLRNKWSIGDKRKSFMAGDGLRDLLQKLKTEPEMGYPFANGFYNSIFRGMRPKKFMLRSAGTGVGKTRFSLADMCNVSTDEIWDNNQKKFIKNGPAFPSLFISSELEQEELQTGMLAHVTGVDEDIIKDGNYGQKIAERLEYGIKILERAPIYAEYVDDFSINDIESIIVEHILEHNVSYIAFDYIQLVPKLARTMQEAFAGSLREDQVLVQLSAALKLIANKYDVYMVSATQINRNAKEHENRDTMSLRGGSATADKVDHGVMMFRVTAKDLENLKHIIEKGYDLKPNFCHYVYKNRGGRWSSVIIWTQYNGGTITEKELFVTDNDFNKLDIKNLHVEITGELQLPEITVEQGNKFIDEHMDKDESEFVPLEEDKESIPEF